MPKLTEILAAWVILQLIVIGIFAGISYNEFLSRCQIVRAGGVVAPQEETSNPTFVVNLNSLVFPLIWFVPDQTLLSCKTPQQGQILATSTEAI